jgi:cytochrome c-type biogenesis protein CcmH
MKLIQRALAIDPNEIKALALAGSEAFDRHDYSAAIGYWQRAIKAGPKEPQFVDQLRGGIEEARKLGGTGAAAPEAMAPAPEAVAAAPAAAAGKGAAAGNTAAPAGKAFVKGRISLAAALAGKAAPTDKLFIFARATQQGVRVPLALMVRQVKDLPVEFSLDESMAMMPEMNLSKFQSVIIGARVSKGGDAIAGSGDLQGFSGPVNVGSTGVQVQIDQVVP